MRRLISETDIQRLYLANYIPSTLTYFRVEARIPNFVVTVLVLYQLATSEITAASLTSLHQSMLITVFLNYYSTLPRYSLKQ